MPLLGGLFGGKVEPGPVVIPVPATVPAALRVYYVPGYPPLLPDDLRARAAAWADAHVEEPLRSALKPLLASPDLTYADMAKTSFPPPLELLAHESVGAEEKARLESAWQVVVVAHPAVTQVPMLGLWAAIAAGRSAALELKGALMDAAARRVVPIAAYEAPLPGRGTLLIADHVGVAAATDARGLARWATTGMVKFGLPEVEIQEAKPGLDFGPLVTALAQHLLDSLLTANHGRPQPVTELSLGPELQLPVGGRQLAFRVLYLAGQGERPGYLDIIPVAAYQGTQADFLASLV